MRPQPSPHAPRSAPLPWGRAPQPHTGTPHPCVRAVPGLGSGPLPKCGGESASPPHLPPRPACLVGLGCLWFFRSLLHPPAPVSLQSAQGSCPAWGGTMPPGPVSPLAARFWVGLFLPPSRSLLGPRRSWRVCVCVRTALSDLCCLRRDHRVPTPSLSPPLPVPFLTLPFCTAGHFNKFF